MSLPHSYQHQTILESNNEFYISEKSSLFHSKIFRFCGVVLISLGLIFCVCLQTNKNEGSLLSFQSLDQNSTIIDSIDFGHDGHSSVQADQNTDLLETENSRGETIADKEPNNPGQKEKLSKIKPAGIETEKYATMIDENKKNSEDTKIAKHEDFATEDSQPVMNQAPLETMPKEKKAKPSTAELSNENFTGMNDQEKISFQEENIPESVKNVKNRQDENPATTDSLPAEKKAKAHAPEVPQENESYTKDQFSLDSQPETGGTSLNDQLQSPVTEELATTDSMPAEKKVKAHAPEVPQENDNHLKVQLSSDSHPETGDTPLTNHHQSTDTEQQATTDAVPGEKKMKVHVPEVSQENEPHSTDQGSLDSQPENGDTYLTDRISTDTGILPAEKKVKAHAPKVSHENESYSKDQRSSDLQPETGDTSLNDQPQSTDNDHSATTDSVPAEKKVLEYAPETSQENESHLKDQVSSDSQPEGGDTSLTDRISTDIDSFPAEMKVKANSPKGSDENESHSKAQVSSDSEPESTDEKSGNAITDGEDDDRLDDSTLLSSPKNDNTNKKDKKTNTEKVKTISHDTEHEKEDDENSLHRNAADDISDQTVGPFAGDEPAAESGDRDKSQEVYEFLTRTPDLPSEIRTPSTLKKRSVNMFQHPKIIEAFHKDEKREDIKRLCFGPQPNIDVYISEDEVSKDVSGSLGITVFALDCRGTEPGRYRLIGFVAAMDMYGNLVNAVDWNQWGGSSVESVVMFNTTTVLFGTAAGAFHWNFMNGNLVRLPFVADTHSLVYRATDDRYYGLYLDELAARHHNAQYAASFDGQTGAIDWEFFYEESHFNYLTVDDNYAYCSSRFLSSLLKVDMRTNEVLWHLGGDHNSFSIYDSEGNLYPNRGGNVPYVLPWGHQHKFQFLGNGFFSLFDNNELPHGMSKPWGTSSRNVVLFVHEEKMEAREVFAYVIGDTAETYGSTEILPSGNILSNSYVNWVFPQNDDHQYHVNIWEISTETKQPVWRLGFKGLNFAKPNDTTTPYPHLFKDPKNEDSLVPIGWSIYNVDRVYPTVSLSGVCLSDEGDGKSYVKFNPFNTIRTQADAPGTAHILLDGKEITKQTFMFQKSWLPRTEQVEFDSNLLPCHLLSEQGLALKVNNQWGNAIIIDLDTTTPRCSTLDQHSIFSNS